MIFPYLTKMDGQIICENPNRLRPVLGMLGFEEDRRLRTKKKYCSVFVKDYDKETVEKLFKYLGWKSFRHYTSPLLWPDVGLGPNISEDDALWLKWLEDSTYVEEEIEASGYEFLRDPYFHQKQAFIGCIVNRRFGLFFDMGLGKTYIAAAVADYFALQGISWITLVVAPKPILNDWRLEIEHFTHELDPYVVTTQIPPPPLSMESGDVVITNYECLRLRPKYFDDYDMVIVDESHYIKNPGAKRSKAVVRKCNKAKQVIALTGTPQSNSVQDLIGQMLILDSGQALGRWFGHFRDRYLWDATINDYPDYRLKDGTYEDIIVRISPYALRKSKEECLDLPDRLFIPHLVPLGNVQSKEYLKTSEFIMDSEIKNGTGSLEVVLNLAKITGGWKGDIKNPVDLRENVKLDLLLELVQNLNGRKFIVWCKFKHDCYIILEALKKLKIEALGYHGDISDKKAEENYRTFQSNPECQGFVSTTSKGGTGLNLTAATEVFVYSMEQSYRLTAQALDRNYRIGQTERVMVHFLSAEHTVDAALYWNWKAKGKLFDKMINQIGDAQSILYDIIYGERECLQTLKN